MNTVWREPGRRWRWWWVCVGWREFESDWRTARSGSQGLEHWQDGHVTTLFSLTNKNNRIWEGEGRAKSFASHHLGGCYTPPGWLLFSSSRQGCSVVCVGNLVYFRSLQKVIMTMVLHVAMQEISPWVCGVMVGLTCPHRLLKVQRVQPRPAPESK